jgi:hypothetical protein
MHVEEESSSFPKPEDSDQKDSNRPLRYLRGFFEEDKGRELLDNASDEAIDVTSGLGRWSRIEQKRSSWFDIRVHFSDSVRGVRK